MCPKVSIVTINYNTTETTGELLHSLTKSKFQDFEVIVVDNASDIDPTIRLKEIYPEVIVINSDSNLGFAGGNNLGIQQATGSFVLIVNSDTEVTEDLIEEMLKPFEFDASVAIVSPKIRFFDRPDLIQYAGFNRINPYTGRSSAVGSREVDQGQYDQSGYTHYAHGAAMMVKKEAIEKVGMLPDLFFLYYEELDWSVQMVKAGYKIYYQHSALIYHKESVSVGKNSVLKTYYLNRNRLLFMRRNFKGLALITFVLFFLFFGLPKAIVRFIFKSQWQHLKSLMKAIMWNFTNLNVHKNTIYTSK